ncbi:hypothetical protein [Priestia megaterium]|uniref:hypothetical protein n=1 Tax=Priestia megaterium TaxID=1404 RepID=UPI0031FBD838
MDKVYVKYVQEKELGINGEIHNSFYEVVIFSDYESETLYYSEFDEMVNVWNPETFFLNISKDIEDMDLKHRFLEIIENNKGFYFKSGFGYEWIEIE